MGWWRYRVPGLGEVDFRRYVDTLYEGGFDGVLSVEHEDPVWGGTPELVEAGLRIAHSNLRGLVVAVTERSSRSATSSRSIPGVKALQGVDLDVLRGRGALPARPERRRQVDADQVRLRRRRADRAARSSSLGEPLPPGDPAGSLKRGVATIYQELDLVADLSVAESIFLAHEPRRGPLLDRDRMYRESAALLDAARARRRSPCARRSARCGPAAQQIVSIARALSGNVRLLIMDEPSAILDEGEIETLFDVVRRLTAEGVGVVYISHRLDEIRRIGDRVTVLADGRTTATGLPATTPTDELVELMVGRKVEQLYPERPVGTDQRAARGARTCGGCPPCAA